MGEIKLNLTSKIQTHLRGRKPTSKGEIPYRPELEERIMEAWTQKPNKRVLARALANQDLTPVDQVSATN